MFFWFKKKKIVLDCFTHDFFAYEYCKPNNSIRYLPQWYVDLPGSFNKETGDVTTIKHCIGFSELYKKSITIPFWDTIKITFGMRGEGFKWSYPQDIQVSDDLNRLVTEHPTIQYNNFRGNSPGHFKLSSPWAFKTSKFVQFTWHEPVWNNSSYAYYALPAVIDFKYQHNTEINFMFKYNDQPGVYTDIIFKPRDPLVMLTPLSDEKIEIKTHLITFKEYISNYNSLRQSPQATNKSPRHLYKMKKKLKEDLFNEQKNEKKCPFGFGKK